MPETTQLDRIESRLARLEQKVDTVLSLSRAELQEQFLMASNLDALTQKVTDIEQVDQAAATLLGELSDIIRNTQPTQEALDALANRLSASRDALAAAIVANTPSAPPPSA